MAKPSKWRLLLTILIGLISFSAPLHAENENTTLQNLRLPDGFKISVYSRLAPQYFQPRMMTFDTQGRLYIAALGSGKILMLEDKNHDGLAEPPIVIAQDLNAPNSVAYFNNVLYIANQDSILKMVEDHGQWSKPVPLIKDLPTGGHTLKTVRVGPDQHLYINVGSSCNVCNEENPLRATLLRYTLEGRPAGHLTTVGWHKPSPIWAEGLRNSQGFTWHPNTQTMYATNNGADNRSDQKNGRINDALPPEHINAIKPGQHYGWPFCWADPSQAGRMFQDPNFLGPDGFCNQTSSPAITLPSHSTPIGITFLEKSQFPSTYRSDAIVALHGSWNRQEPSGYKLVRIRFKNNQPIQVEDFATGWLVNRMAWGRPVDVAIGTDGRLYVSDDKANCIYVIQYQE